MKYKVLMTASQDLLLSSITNYYSKYYDKRVLLEKIIQSQYKISLRLIDWFITHYTRHNNVVLWIDTRTNTFIEKHNVDNADLKKFHIYLEYRTQLKSYTKMFFDPFRRHERISFIISKKPLVAIETTIGQLNFFRWIFQNNILQYIEKNIEHIEEEMTKFQSIKKDPVVQCDEDSCCKTKKTTRAVSKSTQNTHINTSCFLRFD